MEATSLLPIILSLASALFFSLNAIFVKRGMTKVDSRIATFISVVIPLPFLSVYCLLNGDFSYSYLLVQFTIIYLALAGILHFVLGRTMSYYSTQVIGASRTSTLTSTSIIYTTIFSALLLGEPIGIGLLIGVILIFVGTLFVLLSTPIVQTLAKPRRRVAKAVTLGLAAGVIWGLTPILTKLGVLGAKSVLLSTLTSYFFAATVYTAVSIPTNHENFKNILDILFNSEFVGISNRG